jgi:sirohydrochlorin cobaltochelatase
MKRYRHYKKDKAIVLSCFGSVVEQEKYKQLKIIIEKEFDSVDVYLAFSSRMVLKALNKEETLYKNLPQMLSDLDMMGYRNIIVSSINIFPTDEHDVIRNTVAGFNQFSLSNIRNTNAILTKAKETTLFLKNLNAQVTKDDIANLYIIHGTPKLDNAGIASISYASDFLETLDENNFCCSLEGAFPYYAVKEQLVQNMKKQGVKKVQIIPMLLVSGNHYKKDMNEIKGELSIDFDVEIVASLTQSEQFNFIELPDIVDIIKDNLKETITKLGH